VVALVPGQQVTREVKIEAPLEPKAAGVFLVVGGYPWVTISIGGGVTRLSGAAARALPYGSWADVPPAEMRVTWRKNLSGAPVSAGGWCWLPGGS
jgi:hypothetical protein